MCRHIGWRSDIHPARRPSIAQLGVPLDRPLRTPDSRAIIRSLVRQKHDDLLARRTPELPLRTRIRHPPAHWMAPKAARTCEFCTGFVRDFVRFRRIRRKTKRAFLHTSAQRLANKPYFSGSFGDPGRIRTCNLPLRRGLLYPVEPRGLCLKSRT